MNQRFLPLIRVVVVGFAALVILAASGCAGMPPGPTTSHSPYREEPIGGQNSESDASLLSIEDLVDDENGLALVYDALAANPSLAELRLNGRARRIASLGTARAALLPDASVGGYSTRNNIGIDPEDGSFRNETEFGVSATAGWNPDLSGSALRGYRAAQLRAGATELETRRYQETLACQVLEEWVTYIYWDEVIALQHQRHGILRDLEDLTADRFARGVGALDEQIAASSQRLTVEALLEGYQLQRSASLFALARYVNAAPETIGWYLEDTPPLEETVAVPRGLSEPSATAGRQSDVRATESTRGHSGGRSDILAGEARMEAARLERRNAALSGFPQVRLDVGASRTNKNVDDLFDSRVTYEGRAAVTVPLFSGGQRIAMFRSAEALLAAVAAGVEARRLALSTDLATYFAAAARYEAQIEALQRAIAVAEMVAENYHERYQRGQVSLQDLLRAEENRITVEVDISGALRDQALNRIAYACSYGLQLHPTF